MNIKKEATEGTEGISQRLRQLCEQNSDGICQDHLKIEFVGLDLGKVVLPIIKQMTNSNILQVEQRNGKLYWKLLAESKNLPTTDRLENDIYMAIERSGNLGMTTVELVKSVSGTQIKQVNSILKQLTDKKKVKKVAGKSQNRKVIFVLIDVEVSDAVTGGDLYDDGGNFDDEKATILAVAVITHLKERLRSAEMTFNDARQAHKRYQESFSFLPEIRTYLKDNARKHNVNVTNLKDETILRILDGLVLQCLVEKKSHFPAHGAEDVIPLKKPRIDSQMEYKYRFAHKHAVTDNLSLVPCSMCPVALDCEPGGKICPERCRYMSQWLQF